jgi:hypothetical protein
MTTRNAVSRDLGPYGFNGVTATLTPAVGAFTVIRRSIAATGAHGVVIDNTIYAAGSLPYRFRVAKVWGFVATADAVTPAVGIWMGALGTVLRLGEISAAATGYRASTLTVTTPQEAVPGAANGLFVYLDRSVAMEVLILAQRTA